MVRHIFWESLQKKIISLSSIRYCLCQNFLLSYITVFCVKYTTHFFKFPYVKYKSKCNRNEVSYYIKKIHHLSMVYLFFVTYYIIINVISEFCELPKSQHPFANRATPCFAHVCLPI